MPSVALSDASRSRLQRSQSHRIQKQIGTQTLSTAPINQGLRADDVEVSNSSSSDGTVVWASGAPAARRCAPRSLRMRIPMLHPRKHNPLAPSAYITTLCICLCSLSVHQSAAQRWTALRCAARPRQCGVCSQSSSLPLRVPSVPLPFPCPPCPPPKCPRWFPCELSSSPSWPCRP